MSGYLIAFRWFLASIGLFSLWIARRQKRVDAKTHALVLRGLAGAVLVLAIGQSWQKYQSDTSQTQIDVLIFICAFAAATLIVWSGVVSSRNRSASLRARGIDPTVPSGHVRQLLDGGKRIEAIMMYRKETGAWLEEAIDVVDSYLDGKRGEVRS